MSLGTENRYDAVGNVGVDRTAARAFLASLGHYRVGELSSALYGEVAWKPLAGLRVTGGLRGDYYHYSVRARDSVAASLGEGSGSASILSPKASIAYQVTPHLELYANWGRGFHSNDVRGAVNRDTPVPVLVRGIGKELGGRIQFSGVTLTATYWWLHVGSELRFIGDSNAVEPSGASGRHGYEIVAFWRPFPGLRLMETIPPAMRASTMAITSPMHSRTRLQQVPPSFLIPGKPAFGCATLDLLRLSRTTVSGIGAARS